MNIQLDLLRSKLLHSSFDDKRLDVSNKKGLVKSSLAINFEEIDTTEDSENNVIELHFESKSELTGFVGHDLEDSEIAFSLTLEAVSSFTVDITSVSKDVENTVQSLVETDYVRYLVMAACKQFHIEQEGQLLRSTKFSSVPAQYSGDISSDES